MFYRFIVIFSFINTFLFSQQTGIFKNPPDNLTLPVIFTQEDGSPKKDGLTNMESKWVPSSAGESLLQAFTTGSDGGIKRIVKNVLVNANIPENKIKQIKINYTSSGVEEAAINQDAIVFKEDFTSKYDSDKLLLMTKLFRTKNVKIELTDEGGDDFDRAVSAAISDGLRYGNKTESTLGNKMTIEIPALVFGYERVNLTINKVVDNRTSLILGVQTEIGLNSIANLKALEGKPGDFFIRVGTDLQPEPVEFNVSTEVPTTKFRLGNGEVYSMSYIEKSGNKVTLSISGFKVNFE